MAAGTATKPTGLVGTVGGRPPSSPTSPNQCKAYGAVDPSPGNGQGGRPAWAPHTDAGEQPAALASCSSNRSRRALMSIRPKKVSYDVVVVGARCAGAATAMLLARSGLQVLLIDRTRLPADTLSTHALMLGAVVQLRRWDLLDQVAATGATAIDAIDMK